LRQRQRFLFAQNAELLALLVDDAQSRCPNLVIQAGVFGDRSVSLLVGFKVIAF
jgi:hypothetical protein